MVRVPRVRAREATAGGIFRAPLRLEVGPAGVRGRKSAAVRVRRRAVRARQAGELVVPEAGVPLPLAPLRCEEGVRRPLWID